MHTPGLSIFKALLFHLYGVVGRTALIHAAAWKRLFDDLLERRARDQWSNYEPFEIATDYVRYVNGQHGVEVFDDTVAQIQKACARGARSAIVSASENCRAILKRAGLIELSDAAVTGIEAGKLGLAGGFGLVVGVDRGGAGAALLAAGAHVVRADLRQLITTG